MSTDKQELELRSVGTPGDAVLEVVAELLVDLSDAARDEVWKVPESK